MQAFAAYVMRGRVQAILVSSATAMLSLVLLPLSYLSGAVVALVTLRRGPGEGLVVAAGATVVTSAAAALLVQLPASGLAYALVVWLPLWLLAMVLRQTVSLPMALVAAGTLGAAIVIGAYLVVGDPAASWLSALESNFRPMLEGAGIDLDSAQGRQALEASAQLMTGLVAAVGVLSLMCSLLLARWWQAVLYNPGGFRKEFHELRLSLNAAIVAIAVLVIAIWGQGLAGAISRDLVPVLGIVYMLPGLALIHGIVALLGVSALWLVVLYGMLVVALPKVMTVLAGMALADSWWDFRTRLAERRRD